MNFIDKLAWLEIQNRQLLMTRTRGKDTYYIPGGKREAGETDEEALIREVKEELSVDVVDKTIQPMGIFEAQAHGKPSGTIVRMTCYKSEYNGELTPSAEIEELAWFKHEDRFKSSTVDQIIFDELKKQDLID